jgi:hypothetical protein
MVWNPLLLPIADWVVPVLQWAHLHGWTGTVKSGYRTYAQQAVLNAVGKFSAPVAAITSSRATPAAP